MKSNYMPLSRNNNNSNMNTELNEKRMNCADKDSEKVMKSTSDKDHLESDGNPVVNFSKRGIFQFIRSSFYRYAPTKREIDIFHGMVTSVYTMLETKIKSNK